MDYDQHQTLFERKLRVEIEERRGNIAVQVVSGAGVTDFADYRRLSGYVAAFDEVLTMMDAVRARLLKPQE